MKVYLCILLCFVLPYAIGMDHNDNDKAKDEGLASSPDEDEPSCSGHQSPESPDSPPTPSRGPSRSRSVGQLGRVPYPTSSPRKVYPRPSGADSCAIGFSMAPVPEGVQAPGSSGNFTGGNNNNVAGADPSSSAASSQRYGLPTQRSLPDMSLRRRHNSAVDRPCGLGFNTATAQSGAYGTSTTKMFEEFTNLNLSSKIIPKISSRAPVPNRPQQGSVETLRSVTRTYLAVIRGIHADYVNPLGLANPSVRDHSTLMRLLERASTSLQSIRDHPDALSWQSIRSEIFSLTSIRIPEVLSDIRRAVDQYATPGIDHRERLRTILANVLSDMFTIAEQIGGAI